MHHANFRSQLGDFARSEVGSARIALALFAIALAGLGVLAVLGALGVLQVPQLVYLVFATATVFAGWDAYRERRKARRDE